MIHRGGRFVIVECAEGVGAISLIAMAPERVGSPKGGEDELFREIPNHEILNDHHDWI
jgi:hypothetical protein